MWPERRALVGVMSTDVKNSRVSIVIPAWNEEKAIEGVVSQLMRRLRNIEIIVVDDGSSDRTGDLARDGGAHVLRHDFRRGYGASLRSGICATKREYVLFCDADGQHSAEDVALLIRHMEECDMVVGCRGQGSHVPFLRRPGKFVLRVFADFLAGENIPDVNSGLRIIRRDVVVKYLHLMPSGFSFSTTSTFALLKSGHRIKWVPITVKKRVGTSSVQQWRHGPQTLILMLRLSVLFDPLKVFFAIDAVLLALSLVSLCLDLFCSPEKGVGDATVMLTIAVLLVFLFGLLCDQVSALRRESHE